LPTSLNQIPLLLIRQIVRRRPPHWLVGLWQIIDSVNRFDCARWRILGDMSHPLGIRPGVKTVCVAVNHPKKQNHRYQECRFEWLHLAAPWVDKRCWKEETRATHETNIRLRLGRRKKILRFE
jgi:hypothetical protein